MRRSLGMSLSEQDSPILPLSPFTLKAQWVAEIAAVPPDDDAVVAASSVVDDAGSYSNFEISYAGDTGPWAASYAFACNQLGDRTVWIRGEASGNYLVVQGVDAVNIQDNYGYCPS